MGNQQNKSYMNEDVDLTHFKLLRSIGRGSFGKVRIIEHKITKAKLALKYFSKEDLIKRKMSKNIIRERNMLEGLSHPFVCNLRYAFQDDYNLYMALDLMLGGDLRFHLHRRKFSEDELIFLAAEISSAIGYLHSKNIIHRDIKPDNILLDEKGHAHLTDFNIAAYIQPNHLLKSHSGTAQYMAPEMVGDQGYSYGVDWWSLGITFYEGIYGKTPFYDSIKRTRKKECILEQHIDFNVHTVLELSPLFFEFVQKLLNKNPNQRLGSGKTGFFSIQRLPLFNGIEWDLLEKKMLRPPFCPSSEKHNFDMTYDLEELLLEDYPLESLPSKRSKDPKKMSVDMLYLENYYKSYDYYEGPKLRRYSDEQLNKPEMKESPNISKTTVVEADGLGFNGFGY
ncbi:kinase-like protein [Neoconidiobolus thromboides FSU 785]|nr:kinase-like protein [Neoconidiobolus thromboides FSU 785]